MKLEEATAYAAGCFRSEPASCSCACPFRMDIRSFLDKISRGRWLAAYRMLRDATVFPLIAAALCDQPCMAYCQRETLGDEVIAIQGLEEACLKFTNNRKADSYVIPPKSQSVAVIGAGLTGLSCALSLAQKKFLVTIFEKKATWGGALRMHPRFAEFDEDIALQYAAVDVAFRFETEIKSLDELTLFDAVYVATGAGGDSFGLIQSWDERLFATSDRKVFMGGELCGGSALEGIAQGREASKIIEVYLQTGKAVRTFSDSDRGRTDRHLDHTGKACAPLVLPVSPEGGYTREEAQKEAERCLQCDCDKCLASCEMLKHFRKNPHKMAVEVFTDTQVNPPFSACAITRQVYSCNICGHCKSICPENVDMGALMQFSRVARMNAGTHPAALHDFWLKEMDFAAEHAYQVKPSAAEHSCKYVFFPGCQLGAAKPEYILEAYAFLREKYGAAILTDCCGAPAYWAGDEIRLKQTIERHEQSWTDMGKPVFVFACATCRTIFNQFLPEIEQVSIYELLDNARDALTEGGYPEAMIFDPCAARDYDDMQLSVKRLAQKAGALLFEMGEKNRCCGYGGHMRTANPELYDEIVKSRAAVSEKPYIVYCVNCREVFAIQNKECVHILDLALGLGTEIKLPSLQQKRQNSLQVKKEVLMKYCNMEFTPEMQKWDRLELLISDEMQKSMNKKLILDTDIKEMIWLAENAGDVFFDESDGSSVASMIKSVMTYWVRYQKKAEYTFEILDAYSHRMRFGREDDHFDA